MAVGITMAMCKEECMPVADRGAQAGADFENIVAEAFRKAGWRVRRHPAAGDMRADLVVDDGARKYVVEVKSAAEGRRDRLIPLLSQAILQAQAFARQFSERVAPLAVVAARRVPESVAGHIKQFAERHAPEVAVGIIDGRGFRAFLGPGLEGLDAKPSLNAASRIVSPQHLPDLFSDLNQWMLKILVGQRLPASLIEIPREPIRNASQLAEAARVSIMSASRLVNQLSQRGFLDKSEEHLQVVRVEELLDLWISSNRESATERPARWIIKSGQHQLVAALRQYTSQQMHNQPRCCLGLFAAADALGLGFVRGAPLHIYVERFTTDSLLRLGLDVSNRFDRPADIMVRIPANPEAVFRPRVFPHNVPVSDVLQVWLDVSTHPARGEEQAREIQRRIFKPMFGKQ
jgi:Holliday junction resolvase